VSHENDADSSGKEREGMEEGKNQKVAKLRATMPRIGRVLDDGEKKKAPGGGRR